MSDHPEEFKALVGRLSQLPSVEVLALGGSRADGKSDRDSDFDLYVYSNAPISVNERSIAYQGAFSTLELNNQYWETEDDAIFLSCGIAIDIIFRTMGWLENELQRRLEYFQADIGYSTCVLANIASSQILFDRSGRYARYKDMVGRPYPPELAVAIIHKNQPLLANSLAAWRDQILKAFNRGDRISVNHRVAGFLASLFDIIFALNFRFNPGEKRLMDRAVELCTKLPVEFGPLVDRLLSAAASTDKRRGSSEAAFAIDTLCDAIDLLLEAEGLLPVSLK